MGQIADHFARLPHKNPFSRLFGSKIVDAISSIAVLFMSEVLSLSLSLFVSIAVKKVNMVTLAEILSECKSLIAVQCYAINKEYKSMTKAEKFSKLEKLYHGLNGNDSDFIPYVIRFVNGSDQFCGLFEPQASGSTFKLVLKKVVHRQTKEFCVGVEIGDLTAALLKLKSMSANSSSLLGQSMMYYVEKVLENNKKALAHALTFFVQGKMPSGKTYEDFAEYVLDKMFQEPRIGVPGKERPEDWFYRGWFSFLAYGPLPLDELVESSCRLMSLVEAEDANDNKSRLILRKEESLANQAASKKAKLSALRAIQVASAEPEETKKERFVQIMSLQHDANQRAAAHKEDFLKSRLAFALQIYNSEVTMFAVHNDITRVDRARAELDKRNQEWEEYGASLFTKVENFEVDVPFINAYMQTRKKKIINLTGDTEEIMEVQAPKKKGRVEQEIATTTNNFFEEDNADDDNYDVLATTPGVMAQTKLAIINTTESITSKSCATTNLGANQLQIQARQRKHLNRRPRKRPRQEQCTFPLLLLGRVCHPRGSTLMDLPHQNYRLKLTSKVEAEVMKLLWRAR